LALLLKDEVVVIDGETKVLRATMGQVRAATLRYRVALPLCTVALLFYWVNN
jgi:hypothetical protein